MKISKMYLPLFIIFTSIVIILASYGIVDDFGGCGGTTTSENDDGIDLTQNNFSKPNLIQEDAISGEEEYQPNLVKNIKQKSNDSGDICLNINGGQGGKCGDGECDAEEHHPQYPAIKNDGTKIVGTCEKRCAKDCGILCPDKIHYVWDISQCPAKSTQMTSVETKCWPTSNETCTFQGLNPKYKNAIALCNDKNKNVSFDLSPYIWIKKDKIWINVKGNKLEVPPQGYGFNSNMGLLCENYDINSLLWCFDVNKIGLANKKLCIEAVLYDYNDFNTMKYNKYTVFYILINTK